MKHNSFFISTYANASVFSYKKPYYMPDDEVCTVAGLPIIDSCKSNHDTDIPEIICKAIKQHGVEELFHTLGGE